MKGPEPHSREDLCSIALHQQLKISYPEDKLPPDSLVAVTDFLAMYFAEVLIENPELILGSLKEAMFDRISRTIFAGAIQSLLRRAEDATNK